MKETILIIVLFLTSVGFAGESPLKEAYDEIVRNFDESLDISYNLSQGIKDERYEPSLIENLILAMQDDSSESKEEREWWKSWTHAWDLEGGSMEKLNKHLAVEREKMSRSPRGRESIALIDKIQAFYRHIQEEKGEPELLHEVEQLIREYKEMEKAVVVDEDDRGHYPSIILRLKEKERFLLSNEGKAPAGGFFRVTGEDGVERLETLHALDAELVNSLRINEHTTVKEIREELEAKYGKHALPYVLCMKQTYGLMTRRDAEELEQYIRSSDADSDSRSRRVAYKTLERYYACGNTNVISSYEDWEKAAYIYLQHKPEERRGMSSLWVFENDPQRMHILQNYVNKNGGDKLNSGGKLQERERVHQQTPKTAP